MKQRVGGSVFERTIERLLDLVRHTLYVEQSVGRDGLLQRIDARTKLVSALALLLAISFSRRVSVVLFILALTVTFLLASRVSIGAIARSLFVPVVLFAAVLAIPALFMVPGEVVAELPFGISITEQGLRSGSLVASRVIVAASVGVALVLTTPWSQLLRALRTLRVPALVVVLLSMTYRYIFLLLRMSSDMFTARRSRMLALGGGASRQVLFRTTGVLLARSLDESQRVYDAMVSRGFNGEVRLLEDSPLRARDWLAMVIAIVLGALLIWRGVA